MPVKLPYGSENPSEAFEGLFASIPDALITTDTDGTIVSVNACAGHLLSYQPSDMCGMPLEQLVSDRFRDVYTAHRREFIGSGSVTGPELEVCLLGADGTEIPIDATVGRFEDAGNIYIVMVLRDVTDRVATQERLERRLLLDKIVVGVLGRLSVAPSEEIEGQIQQSLIDLSAFADADRGYIFEKSEDGKTLSNTYEWCSPGTESRLDRLQEIPIGSLPWLTKQIDAGQVVEIPSVDDLPEEARNERDFFRQDGIRSVVNVPMMAGSDVVGFIGFNSQRSHHRMWSEDVVSTFLVVQDFFANALRRRRIEKELYRTNRMLRAVTECNDAIIRSSDESTLLREVCRIVVEAGDYKMAWVGTAVNDEEKSVLQIAQWGSHGGYLDDLRLTWSDGPRGTGPAGTAIRTRSPVAVQNVARDPGLELWRDDALKAGFLSTICVPFVLDDQTVGVLAVYAGEVSAFDEPEIEVLQRFTDDLAYGIGALRTRDLQKEAESELRDLLRTKDEFLATVAHELRTPLTAVVGFAQVLTDTDSGLSAPERLELVKMIADEGLDLANIIDDLLVAAKAEAGTLTVSCVTIDLRAQAAQVLESLGQGSLLEVQPPGEPIRITGDPARVRQILRNLISNALRYGGDQIRVSVNSDESTSYLTVIDTGSGVPAEDEAVIFEPYKRAHNAPGLTASMGLGLTISRQLARLMGGDVTYCRESDESIFTLTLPLTTTGD